ncbi:Endonuclease/exonuclease/phosphatase [Zopfochytrium polystomum]|nr:Endonuclease/exonuclease/phosphatase [Zopfochytrium polystomum]
MYERWREQLEISRQSSSPHHHARLAAAAARTAMVASISGAGSSSSSSSSAGSIGSLNGGVVNGSVDSLANATIGPNRGVGLTLASQTGNGANGSEKASQWTVIDLGGMQIKNLSASLFQYSFLTTLYLNHNCLSYLSHHISKLRSLTCLDVSGNKLTSVPPELGLVVSLRELLLFDNQITFLPPELGSLYQLDTLGLEGNPLPESILSQLQREGAAAVVAYLRENIPAGNPPQERGWITLDEDFTPGANDVFTVMCYNTLCDKYATPQAYAYTPTWMLNWEYRRELILQDILNYGADIVCLQEVEMSQFEEYFQVQLAQLGDYKGVFAPKSRARTMGDYERRSVDGCATFFKANKFTLVQNEVVEFQQIALQRPDLRRTEDVFNRVMVKDNIAVITLLESKQAPNHRTLVANAHLHWDPSYKDVKLVQTAMLVEEITRLAATFSRLPGGSSGSADATNAASTLPILLCGDFNSLPNSGVYEFLSRGSVPQHHEDFGNYTYGPYTSEGLSHKLSLKSAYSQINELDFTNFTPSFKGVIDYVWYSSLTLSITGLLGNVDREYVGRTVGLPNAHHPSDHIPLLVSCRWKEDKTRKRLK